MAFEAFEKLSADKKELILSAGMKEFSQRYFVLFHGSKICFVYSLL